MANVRSLSDLNGKDEDDDKRKHNDYYAGGEKSGQLIRGADESDSDHDDEDDPIAGVFNRARRAGAEAGSAADLPGGSKPPAFSGRAQRLDGTVAEPAARLRDEPRAHVITFYRNRIFTVDDGPARRIDDPANAAFIESIGRGECPAELEPGSDVPINVSLVRKDEDYAEPARPAYTAFTGSGRTLAGGASTSSAAAAAAVAASSAADGEWRGVDESQPTTSLQLRLADGSRMVAKFNHSHRISDIRRFIRAAKPGDATTDGAYQLMTAFPNKVIEDESATLEAAGLLNAVIIQKKL